MNDLISRQAAIEYFVTNVGFHDEDGYPIEDSDELRKIWTEYFDGIPSAQKTGKWVSFTNASGEIISSAVHLYPVCSECGVENPVANYCPNCGAKMEDDLWRD